MLAQAAQQLLPSVGATFWGGHMDLAGPGRQHGCCEATSKTCLTW
jgi:hypothetical protein